MSATIKDIVRETGLALATISKYINGGTVRPQNKKIIDEAIRKLNYIPRNTARGLRSSKTYRIGLVSGPPNNPHNAFLLSRIEKNMRAYGYSLIFVCGDLYKGKINEWVPQLLRSGIDGLIITSFSLKPDICSAVENAKIPVVELEEHSHFRQTDCVQTSCTAGSYEITEHLLKMGHRKIAIVTGPSASTTAKERKKGYLRALEDYQIPVDSNYVITGNYGAQFGYQAMQKLWQLPERPTAIFATNYTLCLGIYEAIYSLGIRVPDDLSVVSFDDFELSLLLSPPLTAVRQPLDEMAQQACELLLRRINGDYNDFPRTIRLKPECMYRNSVRNLFTGNPE